MNINTQPSNWHHAAFYCWISDTDSFSFFFSVNTKPDKRLTRNKHAHFLPLECIVSTQSTSSVEKLINKVMSLITLPKLLLVFFLCGNKGWMVFFSCTVAVLPWSCLAQQRVRAETRSTTLRYYCFFGAVWSVKTTADDQSYFNMLAVVSNNRPQVATLSQNIWYEHFISLITPIHITKLDYCMQYKSFIILLGHAYFLNPYIHVARRLLAYKLWL